MCITVPGIIYARSQELSSSCLVCLQGLLMAEPSCLPPPPAPTPSPGFIFVFVYKMSSVGLNSGLSARKASTRVAEPSSQPFFKHLWPPLVLLSLGRRLRTPLGLPGMESSQRPGVERPWGAVPGSGTLGHLCYVDFYGLIYDQVSCALWSFLPATLAARTKSKPSK